MTGARFILLGPIVAELAPQHLLGRYMSFYGLSFTAGVALGPAVGGALLATSPDAVWWRGALAAALTGAGLLRLGERVPNPLLQAQRLPRLRSDPLLTQDGLTPDIRLTTAERAPRAGSTI
jgi:MFS family permease